jgi:hypothetical protein
MKWNRICKVYVARPTITSGANKTNWIKWKQRRSVAARCNRFPFRLQNPFTHANNDILCLSWGTLITAQWKIEVDLFRSPRNFRSWASAATMAKIVVLFCSHNTGNTEVFELKTCKIHEVFCSTTHALTMSPNSPCHRIHNSATWLTRASSNKIPYVFTSFEFKYFSSVPVQLE